MRARVVAPLVAALVGIVAGTATALVAVDASTDEPDPGSTTDPLGLGIPLVRLACAPGQGVLVLGFGETSGALREAKGDNPRDLDLTYVETAESCDTQYGPERFDKQPTYAVVAGPYADLDEPCELRMTPDYKGDSVTALRAGNEITVKCVCVLDAAAAPVLRPGMIADEDAMVWIRSLQQMLVDNKRLVMDKVTGVYDEPTEDAIRELQERSSVTSPPGVVDRPTWDLVQRRTCDFYSF